MVQRYEQFFIKQEEPWSPKGPLAFLSSQKRGRYERGFRRRKLSEILIATERANAPGAIREPLGKGSFYS